MNMVLVYDLRRDPRRRHLLLPDVQSQWKRYLKGNFPVETLEGRIKAIFYAPYEGETMISIEGGSSETTREIVGDESWYVEGRSVRIEEVTFNVPPPIGAMKVITRVWVGEERKGIEKGVL
jgi:hypothetical protein